MSRRSSNSSRRTGGTEESRSSSPQNRTINQALVAALATGPHTDESSGDDRQAPPSQAPLLPNWDGDLPLQEAHPPTRVSSRPGKGVPPERFAQIPSPEEAAGEPPTTQEPNLPTSSLVDLTLSQESTSGASTDAPRRPGSLFNRQNRHSAKRAPWRLAKAPATATEWGDPHLIATGVVAVTPMLMCWTTDLHITTRIEVYRDLGNKSRDGLWTLYCVTAAFTNTYPPLCHTPEDLADTMLAHLARVIADRVIGHPDHRRFPLPKEGSTNAPILDIPFSEITLVTLAGCHPQDIVAYCDAHSLVAEDIFDFKGFPKTCLYDRTPSLKPEVVLRLAHEAYLYFSQLFTSGLTPRALSLLLKVYGGEEELPLSEFIDEIHPSDAKAFIESADPGRYSSIDGLEASHL
ncbi:hypothetical protein B484DRAFT_470902 [Ochromonadaceae sp. CCMP2298]|nr:hypothetical protein B484DRAFT_470902 [Ochromonadaceae sp. CCMP2298]